MWDAVCLGDLFVDLVPHSKADGQWLYLPSPGGAPGNVAAGLAKLGHRALMISRVGEDGFGRLLTDALSAHGVDVSGVVRSASEQAGLSVVTLDAGGERSFMFYHDRPADQHISVDDIATGWWAHAKILHVGILPLASPNSAAAQRRAMEMAEARGMAISCDVNFRPSLWNDAAAMLAAGREVISRAAIVKVSEEELQILQPGAKTDAAVRALWHEGLSHFSVTRGADGALLYTPAGQFVCEGFKVEALDTTGAGDAYTASILSGVLRGLAPPELLRSACAAGALAAARKGAMSSIPTGEELAAFLA